MFILMMKMMRVLMYVIAAQCDLIYWPWIITAISIAVVAVLLAIIFVWYRYVQAVLLYL